LIDEYNVYERGFYLSNIISELTRRNLLEELLAQKIQVEGRLELTDFLGRIWDLEQRESTDSRFDNALYDIWQHMINNSDWDNEYLYFEYFDLLSAPESQFLEFLEKVVHPEVRRSKTEQEQFLELINKHLMGDGYSLQQTDQISGHPIYTSKHNTDHNKGNIKNLIFAVNGYKPEIIISDTLENNIQITKNENYCLVYDEPIPSTGLRWNDLMQWWMKKENINDYEMAKKSLYKRLISSLASEPEIFFFETYHKKMRRSDGDFPVLIPQVYLHYDPYTARQLKGELRVARQRMDFLMLLPLNARIVIEIDGQQHYSENKLPSPKLYSEMVTEDRRLKLKGYEVFRFGGYELTQGVIQEREKRVEYFFKNLFDRFNKFDN